MATFIPTKQIQVDDRGGSHFIIFFLNYDSSIANAIDVDEHVVDAAVVYPTTGATKPAVTVSQNGSSSSVSLAAGGTSGNLAVVVRYAAGGASL